MELGAFSVSLAVKNLSASHAFYETLGFAAFHGDATQGWDRDAQPVDSFKDPVGNRILVDQHV